MSTVANMLLLLETWLLLELSIQPSRFMVQSPAPVVLELMVGKPSAEPPIAVTHDSFDESYAEGSGCSQCSTPAGPPAPETDTDA